MCGCSIEARAVNRRLCNIRKQRARKSDALEHLAAPCTTLAIEHCSARRVTRLAHELAAQLPAQPIFRKQRLGRARKRSGLVLAHPQQFRCLKAWKHAVSCSSQECGETRLMVMQTRADVSAARIVPQNCGAHNIAAPIKRDESVHLSRQPNRFDARACVWNARSDFFDRANS